MYDAMNIKISLSSVVVKKIEVSSCLSLRYLLICKCIAIAATYGYQDILFPINIFSCFNFTHCSYWLIGYTFRFSSGNE